MGNNQNNKNSEENGSFITKKDLMNFIYFGSIILGGIMYVQGLKTDIEVMKTEMNTMKEMIKELHEHHLGTLGKTSFNCYGHDDDFSTNLLNTYISSTEKPISESDNKIPPLHNHHFLYFEDRKNQISISDMEEPKVD